MKFKHDDGDVVLVKDLNISDKDGDWIQVEFVSGERTGDRIPCSLAILEKQS